MPTAVALAANFDVLREGERIATLFDGRNHELICYGLEVRSGEPGSFRLRSGIEPRTGGRFLRRERLRPLCRPHRRAGCAPAAAAEATAERVTGFDHLKPEALALARFQRFDGDLTRLVYIRPAVFPKAEA